MRFKFQTTLVKIDPPTHAEMEGGEVEIFYRSNANIVGKLAMFGDRILKAQAKKLEREFTQALKEKLEGVA